MNCREFEADIVDLARGADSGTQVARRLGEHLEGCPGCAARVERERRLTAQLKALASSAPESPRAAAIEQRLLGVFAERQAEASRPVAASKSVFATRAARRWLAIAATLLIATLAWLGSARWWPAREGQSVSTRAELGPPAPDPAATRAAERADQGTVAQAVEARPREQAPRARTGRSGAPPVERVGNEEVLRFVMLPTAVGMPGLESGRIVRVEVPTAMLPAYGLDVMPGPADGVVEADVLVGQDGQARAIRFVNLDSTQRRRQ